MNPLNRILRPVLRLSAAGAGLDVQKGIIGIHLTGKHAPKFQLGNACFEPIHIGCDRIDGIGVFLLHGHREQVTAVIEPR